MSFTKLLSIVSVIITIGLQSSTLASEKSAELMKQNLDFIGSIFEASYAPKDWKKHYAKWSIEESIADLKNQITPQTTTKDYQRLLSQFFYSAKDYHVGFSFISSEKASLPFTVKKAGNQFIIVYIDREKLPNSSFPFNIGDELVSFDGKPTQEVVDLLVKSSGDNVKSTDESLATLFLTNRRGTKAQWVPKGSVKIEILPKGTEQKKSFQLAWNYTPERIQDPVFENYRIQPNPLKDLSLKTFSMNAQPKSLNHLMDQQMIFPEAVEINKSLAATPNPYGLGVKKSFLPDLGPILWQNEDSKFYHAYIYKNEKNKLIGMVRIASYSTEISAHEAIVQFAALINHLEKSTEALVIDQVNNPGGSVFYLYALASMLTEQPLYTPLHRMTLTQKQIQETYDLLDQLKGKSTEEMIKDIGGPTSTVSGYPVDYNMIQFAKNYAQFIINEWEKGKTITDPYYIFGVDQINPSRIANYTKPILILTNELDFSGGDFFPTIMQDNKRAKILGTRTAGAGGYVLQVSYPNIFGLSSFSYTGSIAERIDKNPIENLGVTPDIEVPFTVKDLQGQYIDYKKRVNEEVQKLLQ
ncbi:MAG TPA: protease-like activity factor CPAF [Pseudobdellovibrionaceae bacterium]|nr:protease-like activity factor CPAF [Pseudobdellovibrionaceae bacterium]